VLRVRGLFLTAVVLGAAASPVFAHRVKVFAYAEGRSVMGRGYFSGGGKPRNCPITVLLPDGTTLLTCKTDDEGRFTFEATVRANLTIILDAGAGHRAEYTLTADQLPEDLPAPAGAAERPQPSTRDAGGDTESQPEPTSRAALAAATRPAAGLTIDEDRLRAIVRAEVQKALRPIREDLKTERDPGPTEIIGGIGYIVGLVGLAAYLRSRAARSTRPSEP